MKERPILFSAPMVLAILEGWKTQTRREVKLLPWMLRAEMTLAEAWADKGFGDGWYLHVRRKLDDTSHRLLCPYGKVGDRLWVRETWAEEEHEGKAVYRATDEGHFPIVGGRWKPSIHMPRWASRITLEITAVRVERLQDISRGDCMAEGCPFPNLARQTDPVGWYADLWRELNGTASWEANPWVWVVEFKQVTNER